LQNDIYIPLTKISNERDFENLMAQTSTRIFSFNQPEPRELVALFGEKVEEKT
jgi:hypothetical protein